MKQCHEVSCVGCPSHCDKSNSPFSYGSYTKGDKIAPPTQMNNIIFLISGELSIKTADSGEDICKRGHMVLLSEKERYRIEARKDSTVLILSFVRSYQICSKISLGDIKFALVDYKYTFHSLAMNKHMKEFVKSTIEFLKDDINCMHIHYARQMELFIITRFYYKEKEVFSFFYPVIDKDIMFQSIVRTHSGAAGSVEELADLCGYNINTFRKVFSATFKESPYKWILQQKADRIKSRLVENCVPIKAIVAEFGFADQSHLNVFCKRYLGGTSVQIRAGATLIVSNKIENIKIH